MRAIVLGSVALGPMAQAADGWWLDDLNLSWYLLNAQLDGELQEMRRQGASTLLVHADVLPGPVLEWTAARATLHGLRPVAWIQWPTKARLDRAAGLRGYSAVQVDDHFFARPPLPVGELSRTLQAQKKELWCSFQPRQLSWEQRRHCDHTDVQLYRLDCATTLQQLE